MELTSYLKVYLTERDVSEQYGKDLGYSLKYLNQWAGRQIVVDDLADDLVNRWLIFLATHMTPESVRHHRKNLLVLWRSAADTGLTDVWPRRVRKIKVRDKAPIAWAINEMKKLLAAARATSGTFKRSNVSLAKFLRAYILVGWDTGLRPTDMVLVCFDQISVAGVLVHVQNKTGEVLICHLKPATLAAVADVATPKREKIFGSLATRDRCYRLFTKLAKSAGLTGSPKKLRKSASTAVEVKKKGAAKRFLGHKSHGLARKHYVDPLHLPQQRRPETPPIDDPPLDPDSDKLAG